MDGQELIKKIAMMVSKTRDREYDCDEVHELIDEIAELQAKGVNWQSQKPEIYHHIAMCGCCKAEFDVLMQILEAEPA